MLLNSHGITFRGITFFIFEDASLLARDAVSVGKHDTTQPPAQCHIPEDTAVRTSNLVSFIPIIESTDANSISK
jgi:hypothetical protein